MSVAPAGKTTQAAVDEVAEVGDVAARVDALWVEGLGDRLLQRVDRAALGGLGPLLRVVGGPSAVPVAAAAPGEAEDEGGGGGHGREPSALTGHAGLLRESSRSTGWPVRSRSRPPGFPSEGSVEARRRTVGPPVSTNSPWYRAGGAAPTHRCRRWESRKGDAPVTLPCPGRDRTVRGGLNRRPARRPPGSPCVYDLPRVWHRGHKGSAVVRATARRGARACPRSRSTTKGR